MADKLQELRKEIDRLDDEILSALRSRWRLSGEIIAAKNGQTAFRPGREADVIRRLVSAAPDMKPATILGIWRQIFSASIAQQDSDIEISVHKDVLAAAVWHFGSSMQLSAYDDIGQTIMALDTGARYAMVPCDLGNDIASALCRQDGRFIVGKTPLYNVTGVSAAYIIGDHISDNSTHDEMLFAVDGPNGVTLEVRDYDPDAKRMSADGVKLIGITAR